MITLNTDSILRKNIGLNGLSQKTLDRFFEKNKKAIGKVFKNKKKLGFNFLELPDNSALVRQINAFAKAQAKHKWENIVVLGIGGSSLGLIALQDSILGPLHNLKAKPRLFVVDNIDPAYTDELLKTIKAEKTLFIVISKSGGTTEPMIQYSVIRELLEKKKLKLSKHLVFVTDPKKGLLRPIAKKEGITAFEVPDKVGGRFSVLSAVGLLPAALVGIDISALLRGAKKMRESIKKNNSVCNPAFQLASIQYLLDKRKGKAMTVLMPYSNYLFRVGDWYRQLLAESIGKNLRSGPTPINALGTTDQHSQLQLYSQGPNNKFFIFMRLNAHKSDLKTADNLPKDIGFLSKKKFSTVMDAAYSGTMQSLTKNKRPNLTLTLSKVNEETIGELFMLFEFQVALLGEFYRVDAFNQPGVELSKVITKQILSEK